MSIQNVVLTCILHVLDLFITHTASMNSLEVSFLSFFLGILSPKEKNNYLSPSSSSSLFLYVSGVALQHSPYKQLPTYNKNFVFFHFSSPPSQWSYYSALLCI